MAYSKEVLQKGRQRLADRKADKESRYNQNLLEAYRQQPRLKEIDHLLRASMTKVAQTVFTEGGDPVAAMEQIKQENLALQQERKLLVATSFAPNFLDESPVCSHCGGSGYIGSTMCSCLSALCREEQRKQLWQLTDGSQRFECFRLDYYSDRLEPEYGASCRTIMKRNLEHCQSYARAFGPDSGNLIFNGGTGLGKTFMSACIANVVVDKGYSVAYESAAQLFKKLEKNRFSPSEETRTEVAKFTDSDLLIIDDLGTELSGAFVTAALYDLLNERLLSGKSTIISTNLSAEEMAKRYSPQIASRLGGNFKGLTFVGEDIRVLKNRGV